MNILPGIGKERQRAVDYIGNRSVPHSQKTQFRGHIVFLHSQRQQHRFRSSFVFRHKKKHGPNKYARLISYLHVQFTDSYRHGDWRVCCGNRSVRWDDRRVCCGDRSVCCGDRRIRCGDDRGWRFGSWRWVFACGDKTRNAATNHAMEKREKYN